MVLCLPFVEYRCVVVNGQVKVFTNSAEDLTNVHRYDVQQRLYEEDRNSLSELMSDKNLIVIARLLAVEEPIGRLNLDPNS